MDGEILLLAPYLAGLKLLLISGDIFNKVTGEESRELIWLHWWRIGQRNLPSWLSLKNLRVLQLKEEHEVEHHLEELWEAENNAPSELRQIDISNCHKFQRFPNSIGCLSELKRITINGRNNVSTLPAEFCHLRSLEHLCLPDCQISSLPNNFGHLTNLRYLNLRGCSNLRSLPVTFKNLALLQHLDLEGCTELILISDDFQNITELEFLSLYECRQVEELPYNITNMASLKELDLSRATRLRELPDDFGDLGRLRKIRIGSSIMKSLPSSLGNLSSLTLLSIVNCPSLESLPLSLGNLSSLTLLLIVNCPSLESLSPSLGELFPLTDLAIYQCPKLKFLPFSLGRLNLLESLEISACPISQVDFEMAALSPSLSNLKRVFLHHTEVCRISVSEDSCPRLEMLDIAHNYQLKEIEALPVNLEILIIKSCPNLDVLPSFSAVTSLKEFEARDCDRIERFEGLVHCTRLEKLILHTCWDVPGIDSLEHMEKLRVLQLRANTGSMIESCIRSIKKWPDEIIICTRAVPDASSLLDSFKLELSPNLLVVDSFSDKDSCDRPKLVLNCFSNHNAIMLCYVIKSVTSLQINIYGGGIRSSSMGIGEGTWAVMGVLTQCSKWLQTEDLSRHAFHLSAGKEIFHLSVERGLVVTGEEKSLVEAFCHLIHGRIMYR